VDGICKNVLLGVATGERCILAIGTWCSRMLMWPTLYKIYWQSVAGFRAGLHSHIPTTTQEAWFHRELQCMPPATASTMLAPSAGRVAESWNRTDARWVMEYSWSGTENWRDTSLAIASSTVIISLTASTRAFSRWVGVRDLVIVRAEVLRVSVDGSVGWEGGEGGEGCGRDGVCDVARVPILQVF